MSVGWYEIDIAALPDADPSRVLAIVGALGRQVRFVGGDSWKAECYPFEDRDLARSAVERLLNEIDPDWREVLQVA